MDEERDDDGDDHQAGPGLLPEAHELPDAHPDLQGARAQLPRPADAARRERHRLPQRALRRAARPDPRARLHPGRLAPVRHARPARGRGRQGPRVRPLDAARLRSRRLRARAVDARRREVEVDRLRRVLGVRRPTRCATSPSRAGSSSPRCPARPRSTVRRSTSRRRDAIGRTWQLSTVQVDPNLPERFELEFTGHGRRRRSARS